jgi:hypothetical protein
MREPVTTAGARAVGIATPSDKTQAVPQKPGPCEPQHLSQAVPLTTCPPPQCMAPAMLLVGTVTDAE